MPQIFLGVQRREQLRASCSELGAEAEWQADEGVITPPSPGVPSSRERRAQQFNLVAAQIEKVSG